MSDSGILCAVKRPRLQDEFSPTSGSNIIDASLQIHRGNIILIEVNGIVDCAGQCTMIEDPAWIDIALPELNGAYDFVVKYVDRQDRYRLDIAAEKLSFSILDSNNVSKIKYLDWKRLPPDTIWVLIFGGAWNVGNGGFEYSELPAIERDKSSALEQLTELGVEEFIPEEGNYTNYFFMPPWSTWQIENSDGSVMIHNSPMNISVRSPAIKYYHYNDDWSKITEIVDAFKDSDVYIYAMNWTGDLHLMRTKER